MAESKRNSVPSKTAPPKNAAAQPVDYEATKEALGKAIGGRIRIITAAQTYEGTLFTYCPIYDVVIIETRNGHGTAATKPGDYRTIPTGAILQDPVLLSPPTGSNAWNGTIKGAQPSLTQVDLKALQQKAQAKINKLKEEELNRGKGVTQEAQAIFDSFKRINMPVRWHGQAMIVHDAVIITSPYRSEDCKCPKDKQEVLNRVKRVLEGERKKIKERDDQARKAATPVGPRKGG